VRDYTTAPHPPKGIDQLEAVKKALGEPFAAEFSDKIWKIRTNLLVVSLISLFVIKARLRIEESTILGIKFAGLTDELVHRGLFWITLYLTIHFGWSSWDHLCEWRLRITGTKLSFVTTGRFSSQYGDYPNDARQSTLYHWWNEESRKIGNLSTIAQTLDGKMSEWETRVREKVCDSHQNCMNVRSGAQSIVEVRGVVHEMTRAVEETTKTLSSLRIPTSLDRFDRCFLLALRSQSLRWIVIDFLLPITLGCLALFLL
jgi:hypothetical protein